MLPTLTAYSYTGKMAPSSAWLRKRDLRAAFQVELEQSGLGTARAADQIGGHASSITRWLNGTYAGDSDAVAADVECWLDTRADTASRSLDGTGHDRYTETTASRQITSALAYAHVQGDIVAIIGKPGGGETWASERYSAGRTTAFNLSASSAVFSLPGLLSLVGEAIGAGRHHHSALEAERTIIDRLRDRQALIVVDEAHHLRDKLLDELRIIRGRAGCGLALMADGTICMALARCQHVDGRIGLKSDLATQPTADVEYIAASALGRQPTKPELKSPTAVGRGPGGLHTLRPSLGPCLDVGSGGWTERDRGRRHHPAADEGAAAPGTG